jgi:hypothetical protein
LIVEVHPTIKEGGKMSGHIQTEAPWWFKLAVVTVAAVIAAQAIFLFDDAGRRGDTKNFCTALHELGHYETKVEADTCWVNLSMSEGSPQWVPASWMNVG